MSFFHNFWQLTVDGLSTGSLYAVIALGYTLVYGVLQLINFAHSEVFMLGSFAGLFAVRGVAPGGATGWLSVGLIVFGLLCGAAGGGLAAFVLERTAYAPLRRRGAPKLAYLISAIGASYFTFNLAGKEFGRQNVNAPQLYSDSRVLFHVFSAKVQINTVLVFGVAVLMLIALDRLVNGTRLGKAIRAVAQDSDTASLMGIDVNRIIIFTFVIGGTARGRRRLSVCPGLLGQLHDGLPAGHKSLHGGGARRYRQRARCHARRGLVLGVVEAYGGQLAGRQLRGCGGIPGARSRAAVSPVRLAGRTAGEGGMSIPVAQGQAPRHAQSRPPIFRLTKGDRGQPSWPASCCLWWLCDRYRPETAAATSRCMRDRRAPCMLRALLFVLGGLDPVGGAGRRAGS